MEKKEYKPKIGKKIYTIWKGDIVEDRVEYLGKDGFLIEDYDIKIISGYYYKDYDEKWFTSLAKAKKRCKENFGEVHKIYLLED